MAILDTVSRSFSEQEIRAYQEFLRNNQKIAKEFIRRLADNYPRGLDKGAFCSELKEFVGYFGNGAHFADEAEKQGLCKYDEVIWR